MKTKKTSDNSEVARGDANFVQPVSTATSLTKQIVGVVTVLADDFGCVRYRPLLTI